MGVAHAQSKAALAEGLFNDGKRLLDAGQVSAACGKFSESQNLDPAPGTLFFLATCHEKEGKLASAWGEYLEVAPQYARVGKAEKEQLCKDRAAALEPKLSRLTLNMADKPQGLTLTIDGKSLGEGLLGTPLPLDPGVHTLVVSAPGKKSAEQKITVAPSAGTTKVDIPALETDTSGGTGAGNGNGAGTGAGNGNGNGNGGKRVIQTEPDTTRRTVGFIVGGGGIALGIGAAIMQFGFAKPNANKRDQIAAVQAKFPRNPNGTAVDPAQTIASDQCPAGCTDEQYNKSRTSYNDAAQSSQIAAIVLGISGIAAIGTGIVLIATSGGSKTVEQSARGNFQWTPYVGAGNAGITGSF
jgi:hypothetical protein